MIYFQYGAKIYDLNSSSFGVNDGVDPFINQSKSALDRWRKPGDRSANPRRLLFGAYEGVSDRGTNVSTRYLYDANFARLSNVSLAYNFPLTVIEKLRFSTLRVFLQGHNLATWTNYPGQDPEAVNAVGAGATNYPLQRTYSAGITANF